jgi:predicted TIM-barrel fold metal-dependent hydrolase
VNLAGGYDRWRTMSLELIARLDPVARQNVLGANAARVYL